MEILNGSLECAKTLFAEGLEILRAKVFAYQNVKRSGRNVVRLKNLTNRLLTVLTTFFNELWEVFVGQSVTYPPIGVSGQWCTIEDSVDRGVQDPISPPALRDNMVIVEAYWDLASSR